LEKDKLHRVDVRHLPFVTIDGEDARDFDDAVLCERRKGGWRLYVAIADVSHYVPVESALDIEARARGNSVYFPDYVVPMLPEAISNGLCSLNPHVDRLCMVCEMTISDSGRITGYQFYEGVMHSHARLTYTKVGEILTGEGDTRVALREEYKAVVPQLELLHKLYQCLRIARDERGAIDFDTVETRIQFNEERKIERIVPIKRNDAHKLIEECMLCANVCAAQFIEKHNLIGLFRVHEGPTETKLANLRAYLSELGLGLAGGDKPTPGDYQQLLQMIQDRSDGHLIQTVMLRSLRQAMYQVENHGHFGLGYEAYTHFTSPIRRYPDLLVHRAIRSVVRGTEPTTHVRRVDTAKAVPKKFIYPYTASDMVVFGEQCSRTERRADEATRDVVSWLKCEYLRDQVGAVYAGHVSAVTSFGLFVELNDLYVEGLIHITSLPHDYYRFEPAQHRLMGERTRKVFGLGDELVVRVVRVDLDNRKIDFELESANAIRRPKSAVKPKVAKRGASQSPNNKKTEGKKAGGGKHFAAPVVTTSGGVTGDSKKSPSGIVVKKAVSEKPATKQSSSKQSSAKTTAAKPAAKVKADKTKKPAVKTNAGGKKTSAAQPAAKAPVVKAPVVKTVVAKKIVVKKVAEAGVAPTAASAKKEAAPAKKVTATKTPAAKKVSAQKPASAKSKGEVDHGRKNAKAASKAAPATVQSPAPKATKGKAVTGSAKTTAKKPVVKTKAKD
jgi:ribonuclease R